MALLFWLGIILILLFSVTFHSFRRGQHPGSHRERGLKQPSALVLPVATLGDGHDRAVQPFRGCIVVIENLTEDHARMARAKGVPGNGDSVQTHALWDLAIPRITLLDLSLPSDHSI